MIWPNSRPRHTGGAETAFTRRAGTRSGENPEVASEATSWRPSTPSSGKTRGDDIRGIRAQFSRRFCNDAGVNILEIVKQTSHL